MSLLDEMTKGIGTAGVMERKAEKASRLTPVAGEAAATILPKDLPGMYMAGEQLAEAVKTLRAAADAIEVLIGQQASSSQPTQIAVAKSKANERFEGKDPEPTEQSAFEARLAAQSEAAQAATFASLDATDEEPAAPAPTASGEWVCPVHGDKAIVNLKAKDRTIRACDKCDQVEH